ncbi:Liprin-alpha-1, partial [Cichlidogyrus casuarinus]
MMPTISENGVTQGDHESINSAEGANVEDMLLSMLDERDRLMEALRSAQEQVEFTRNQLADAQRERDLIQHEMESYIPQDVAAYTKQIAELREQLNDRNEEVSDLKAERNNTKLLLEHLECLVARHERSLRMTVIKRQANIPGSVASQLESNLSGSIDFNSTGGISSEVEVLKALKSLFDHHKALDEKIRERLKVAQERANNLQDLLSETESQLKFERNRSSALEHTHPHAAPYRAHHMTDKSTNTDFNFRPQMQSPLETSKSVEMQMRECEHLRKMLNEKEENLIEAKRKIMELNNRISDLDMDSNRIQQKAKFQNEQIEKLRGDVEKRQQGQDLLEVRATELECKYMQAQKDLASSTEENAKLKNDVMSKTSWISQLQEKTKDLERKLNQTSTELKELIHSNVQQSPNALLEPISNQLKDMAPGHAKQMQLLREELEETRKQLVDARADLEKAKNRESMNDESNQRLVATVDRLLTESNERLQRHLEERMQSLQQKRDLAHELDHLRRLLQETQKNRDQAREECVKLRKEQNLLLATVRQYRTEFTELQSMMMNKMIQNNDSLLTPMIPNSSPLSEQHKSHSIKSHSNSQGPSSAPVTSRLNENRMYPEKPPASLTEDPSLATYQNAADIYGKLPLNNLLNGSVELEGKQPSSHSWGWARHQNDDDQAQFNPQALAEIIQDQLNAINAEIRLIEEEKQNTDIRSEEIQSRAGMVDEVCCSPVPKCRVSDVVDSRFQGPLTPGVVRKANAGQIGSPRHSTLPAKMSHRAAAMNQPPAPGQFMHGMRSQHFSPRPEQVSPQHSGTEVKSLEKMLAQGKAEADNATKPSSERRLQTGQSSSGIARAYDLPVRFPTTQQANPTPTGPNLDGKVRRHVPSWPTIPLAI